ncbi:heavy metal translocating P-type ATPase [Schleiferia thermophila]|uniref:heavy metal translocating P-type ATPase n=1 Tax=Schleiferia thermophila TaxID=884107 RepID=UPI002FD925A7
MAFIDMTKIANFYDNWDVLLSFIIVYRPSHSNLCEELGDMGDYCFHCGESIEDERVDFDNKAFCCHGCKQVYQILKENSLENFYLLNPSAGVTMKHKTGGKGRYDYLDNKEIAEKILSFKDGGIAVVRWNLPKIHCSSCVWLLENLPKLHKGVLSVVVNFPKRTAQITYREADIKLSDLAELLSYLGYPPSLSLADVQGENKKNHSYDRSLIYQLAVAGFCFGNIMLLSIPEYLGMNNIGDENYARYFRFVSMVLSLPVVLYSSQEYYKSAWAGLRNKVINIDVPIVLGILIIFFRSLYEVFILNEPGFFDSLAGLLFFLLIGKYYQRKTYERLSFDRDYAAYFPMAVTRVKEDGSEEIVAIGKIEQGDFLRIHSDEIVPVDAILVEGKALIDNSFVTGEAIPLVKNPGDRIYAGGRQKGERILVKSLKPLDQSYLTGVWNQHTHKKDIKLIKDLTDKISKRFTLWLLVVALGGFLAWLPFDASTALNVLTAVLIVACPCALALAAPFAESTMMLHLGRKGLYLKDAPTVEKLSDIQYFVFDKTGTLTISSEGEVSFSGTITREEASLVRAITENSLHPLSRILSKNLPACKAVIDYFEEIKGHGMTGVVNGLKVKIGSSTYVKNAETVGADTNSSEVHVEIDGRYLGYFEIRNKYRPNIEKLFLAIKDYPITILSGDNDRELPYLKKLLPPKAEIIFNQKPTDKLKYIENLEKKGVKTLMAGDGLNDAGALMVSHMGISVAEDIYSFSPACDAILQASSLHQLHSFIHAARYTVKTIKQSFVISLLYNLAGLGFALAGVLEPIVCAILMPISSITVVGYVVLKTTSGAQKLLYKTTNDSLVQVKSARLKLYGDAVPSE